MISITVTAAAKTSRCTKTTSPLNNLNISPEIKGRHYSSARPGPNEWTISTIFSNQLISCSVKWKTKVLINLFVMEIIAFYVCCLLVKEIYLACIKFSRAPKHQVHTLMKLVTIILTKG